MENKSNGKHKTLKILFAILIVFVILGIGVFVGLNANHFRKVKGDRFIFRNMDDFGRRGAMPGRMKEGKQFSINRQSGEITSISGNNLIIKNSDNKEINVAILEDTAIYSSDGNIANTADLKVGSKIIVSGKPNSAGAVQANIITIE